MARPTKNNADFFGHDHDMRNHRKIKAIRAKFGLVGYAIWSMFLEVLTGAEENRWTYNELETELLAGDFGVSVTEIRELLDYCVRLELLFSENDRIYSKTLDERLKSVYEKRNLAKQNYQKQAKNGINSTSKGVSVTEMTQRESKEKVKEKENTTDVVKKEKNPTQPYVFQEDVPDFVLQNREDLNEQMKTNPPQFREPPPTWTEMEFILANAPELKNTACKNNNLTDVEFQEFVKRFVGDQKAIGKVIISEGDTRTHFLYWIPKHVQIKNKQRQTDQDNGPPKGKIQKAVETTRSAADKIRQSRESQNN